MAITRSATTFLPIPAKTFPLLEAYELYEQRIPIRKSLDNASLSETSTFFTILGFLLRHTYEASEVGALSWE